MLGCWWLRLNLSKPLWRVFIDSPDKPVNLGLEHPPRPHVRSGWLDWRLGPYGFILRSTCSHWKFRGRKTVQADDVRDVKGVCNLSEEMSGANGGERRCSFIRLHSTFPGCFCHICLKHTCWVPPQKDFNSMFYFPKYTAHGRCAYAHVPPSLLCFCWTGCRKKTLPAILDSKETFTFELQ